VKVAERKTQTRRSATGRRAGTAGGGPDSLGRLNDSIEAAEMALKDLRSGMTRGSRELLKDVDKTLRDARKKLRRASRRIAKELEGVEQAAGGKRTATTRKGTSRRRTGSGRSGARGGAAKK
jgi:hypothetical protein